MSQSKAWRGPNRAILNDGVTKQYVLHNTAVVTIKGNVATLNNGGYKTATTQRAINQALNEEGFPAHLRVAQRDFEWFVGDQPFHNRMEVSK